MTTDIIRAPSPIESLVFGPIGVWDILQYDQFDSRIKLREKLNSHKIDEELYFLINDLLDSGNDRFVLYCPFDIIPHCNLYRKCNKHVDGFLELYMNSWNRMLGVFDNSADFLDGDLENSDMTIQASYLAPILMQKELINSGDYEHYKPRNLLQNMYFNGSVLYDGNQYSGIDGKRSKWLRSHRYNKSVEYIAKSVNVFKFHPLSIDSKNIFISGIRSAIESSRSKELYNKFRHNLIEFLHDDALYDSVVKTFRRLYSIGVIGLEELDQLGIRYYNLDGRFCENLNGVGITQFDDELLRYIYPVSVLYGSRLKGYGRGSSDIDRAVFIRPGVVEDIGPLLKSRFGDVVEYRLEEDGDYLKIINNPELKPEFGYDLDVHVLFGGVWDGDASTISMFGQKLLQPYIDSCDKKLRRVWLENMERDVLQYRLLHHGYESCCAVASDNVFMDDGYRWLAAKLYASNVLVPSFYGN